MRLPSANLAPLALAAAVLAAALALVAIARAQGGPVAGGTVPSTLALSLSEPSPFKRVGPAAGGQSAYAATIRAEVSATDTPTRLSLDKGPPLRSWREPLVAEPAKIQLREIAPDRRALRNRTVLVTLTAGGP